MTNLVIVLVGFVVGVLVGLTGVGGGSIMTPLLVLALRVHPAVAVGTDLVYSVPTKLLGAATHWRQGTVNGRAVAALLAGGIPAAAGGLAILSRLRAHADTAQVDAWMRHAIGAGLLLAAAMLLLAPLYRRVRPPRPRQPTAVTYVLVALIGAVVGIIVTITSIGSGAVTLPLLALALPSLGLAELVGSDVAYAALLIPTAAFGRWRMGDVNLPLALTLLAGSIPGVFLGSLLCRRVQQRWLRPAIALTLAIAASRLV